MIRNGVLKRILTCLLIAVSLTSCLQESKEKNPPDDGGLVWQPYFQISQAQARQMMAADDGHVIVDVRRQDEYEAGHIPGAILIPNETIDTERPAELPDLNQVILIYCRSGNRSKQAAEKLGRMGYTNVYEFGGIIDWTGEIVTGSQPQSIAGEAQVAAEPSVGQTGEPTDTSVPIADSEQSGHFEWRSTWKVDACGVLQSEVRELVAACPAALKDSEYAHGCLFFFFDQGSRNREDSFFICLTNQELPTVIVDDSGRSDDHIGPPVSFIPAKQVRYSIDAAVYTVAYDQPYIVREGDFDRIFTALSEGKDIGFTLTIDSTCISFTICGTGFAEMITSIC